MLLIFQKEMGKDGENEDMMEKLMGQFEENGAYRGTPLALYSCFLLVLKT